MTSDANVVSHGSLSRRLLIWTLVSGGILYLSGWTVGQPNPIVVEVAIDGTLVTKSGVFVHAYGDWYGAWIEPRFFDAPLVSLIALGATLAMLGWITRTYVIFYSFV